MRNITHIVVHCAATIEGRNHSVQELARWHKGRGFATIGYHYVVLLDGSVAIGRPEAQVGAHVQGHNAHSIGVCYIGGLGLDAKPKDTRTPAQKTALVELLRSLKARYPQAVILGHRDLSPDLNKDGKVTPNEWVKACPSFDAQAEYAELRAKGETPDGRGPAANAAPASGVTKGKGGIPDAGVPGAARRPGSGMTPKKR